MGFGIGVSMNVPAAGQILLYESKYELSIDL